MTGEPPRTQGGSPVFAEQSRAGTGSPAVVLPARHSAWIARCLGRGELAPLDPDDADELAAALGERSYPAGTTLFRVGELPARVHVVRRGVVELSRQINGRRVVLQLLRAGDVFGDVPLLVRMTEPFDARTIEDSVVLSIDSVELFGMLQRRPRLAQRWLVSLALRMAATQARLVDLLAGGLDAQVASLLVRQAEEGIVCLRQSMLAELLGARRPSVNRVLKGLERAGLLRLGYREIEVLDIAGLLAVASGDPSGLAAPVGDLG